VRSATVVVNEESLSVFDAYRTSDVRMELVLARFDIKASKNCTIILEMLYFFVNKLSFLACRSDGVVYFAAKLSLSFVERSFGAFSKSISGSIAREKN
jgi:hypothetical protein